MPSMGKQSPSVPLLQRGIKGGFHKTAASPASNGLSATTKRPLIFDIKRHGLDDGPGIRTAVFFKGCPLNCLWCHNPESIDPGPEIAFYPSECIHCGDCAKTCPAGAIRMESAKRIDREKCDQCGKCAEVCPGRGLRRVGRFYEIDELVEIVLRDRAFYESSGGGVTLSGGEPTLFMDYASRLLQALKANGIHTAIETCGFFDCDGFKAKVMPWLDLILFDLKLMDSDLHLKYTGKHNRIILENLQRLVSERPDRVLPRIPLIPGITAEPENLRQLASFLRSIGAGRCWLLPYNALGFSKRGPLGKPPVDLPSCMLAEDEIQQIRSCFDGIELIEM